MQESDVFALAVCLYFITTFSVVTGLAKAAKIHNVSIPGQAVGPMSMLSTPACVITIIVGLQTRSLVWTLLVAVPAVVATGYLTYVIFDRSWKKEKRR